MLEETTTGLQGQRVDVYKAYKTVEDVRQEYQHIRDDVENLTTQCFDDAKRMATAVGTEPEAPRTARVQRQLANASADNVEVAYRRNLVIPMLDEILAQMEARFQSVGASAGKLCGLLPSVLCSTDTATDVTSIMETYSHDLASPEQLDVEVARWQRKFGPVPAPARPNNFASALSQCDQSSFPNIHLLLKIACTMPATSCECERCCSVLRQLSNYMRSTMGQERLFSLALLHIHYEKQIDLSYVYS